MTKLPAAEPKLDLLLERVIDVRLDRPRQRNSPDFLALRNEILEELHFAGQSPEARPRGVE